MTLALLALGALVALLVLARYRHAPTVRDWAFALSAEAADTVAQVEHAAQMDQEMMADAWSRAEAARMAKDTQEAVRLLELAFWVVEDATPSRLERLRAMARLCRQAAAVLPLPAIRPSAFRLHRLKGLAFLGALAHAVLVTATERAWLRARMLLAAFGVLLWTLRRAKDGAKAAPAALRYWRRFGAALGDWKAADVATTEGYRAAHMTLANEMRAR